MITTIIIVRGMSLKIAARSNIGFLKLLDLYTLNPHTTELFKIVIINEYMRVIPLDIKSLKFFGKTAHGV